MDDWKKDFIYGTLLIWPSDSVRNSVNALRTKYDPESQQVCDAHITLTQPFLNQPSDEDWQEIHSVLAQHTSFDIHYGPIEVFGSSPVVKFDIVPKEKILALRNALHATQLFNLALPFTEGFIPHMTISEHGFSDLEEAKQAASTLNSSYQSGSFTCAEIAYVKPDDTFHFEEIRLLPLGA